MSTVQQPFPFFPDLGGDPLESGYIYIGLANQDPQTSPKQVYWDAGFTIPATQPIRTLGGYIVRNGTPANAWVDGTYSITVRNRGGALVGTFPSTDNAYVTSASLAASTGAAGVGFIQAGDGAVATDSQAKMRERISAFDAMTAAQVADVTANSTTLNTSPAIQKAIAWVSGGGGVWAPNGTYKLLPPAPNEACIQVPTNNLRLSGNGPGSILKTSANKDVPIDVSTQLDLGNNTQDSNVTNVTIDNIAVKGTGTYEYFGLAYGRGILLRGVASAIVTNTYVTGMSMIGICSEGGAGSAIPAYLVNANILTDNKYSAFNFNGRSFLSIGSNNICYGSNGAVNSCAIQATGHSILNANTVYGDIVNYALSGGVVWGEGPYVGIGSITAHLVKHCQFGFKSVYHGPVLINGNVAINCRSTGGVVMVGGTAAGLPVSSSDSAVNNNLLVNNYPYDIDVTTPRTLVANNRCVYLSTVINAGNNNDPDALQVVRAEAAIHVATDGISLVGNLITGQLRGLLIRQDSFLTLGAVSANEITGTSAGAVGIESDVSPSLVVATIPLFERKSNGNGNYVNEYFSSSKCLEGFWGQGDTWRRYPSGVGLTLGETCVGVVASATPAVQAVAGAVNITLVSAASLSIATGNILGIELDNHQYHWTTITNIAGAVITIGAAIPAGRTANIGTRMYWQQWAPLAVL